MCCARREYVTGLSEHVSITRRRSETIKHTYCLSSLSCAIWTTNNFFFWKHMASNGFSWRQIPYCILAYACSKIVWFAPLNWDKTYCFRLPWWLQTLKVKQIWRKRAYWNCLNRQRTWHPLNKNYLRQSHKIGRLSSFSCKNRWGWADSFYCLLILFALDMNKGG